MPETYCPFQNQLLAALPQAEFHRVSPGLALVHLAQGDVLCESGDPVHQVYFPTTAIVSMLSVLEDGASTDIAVIGHEGMLGIASMMGDDTATCHHVVLSAGYCYSLHVQQMRAEFNLAGPFMHLLQRYTLALMCQMTQNAVCNRHHSLEQQLCRWILLNLDRLPSNSLSMTQDLIASMLGVRREGVSEAAGKLQRDGLIHYSRGQILVHDRAGLEQRVCECYGAVKREFHRLHVTAPHGGPAHAQNTSPAMLIANGRCATRCGDCHNPIRTQHTTLHHGH